MAHRTQELPLELLIEIGRLATDWAVIEQEIMMWASALAARDTDGMPTDWLRLDFKRLREKWYGLAKAKLPANWLPKLDDLNRRLADASVTRGYALNGVWRVKALQTYEVHWFEQKTGLASYTLPTTLAEFRGVVNRLRDLRFDLVMFASGAHGTEDH